MFGCINVSLKIEAAGDRLEMALVGLLQRPFPSFHKSLAQVQTTGGVVFSNVHERVHQAVCKHPEASKVEPEVKPRPCPLSAVHAQVIQN